jgi:cell division protein ZapE
MSNLTLLERYHVAVDSGLIQVDKEQVRALEQLECLANNLEQQKPKFINYIIKKKTNSLKGCYLWGGVGRGKTFLMDLFFESIHFKKKQRWHFHRFMQWLHMQLREHRGQKNPLEKIAKNLRRSTELLCFDEFFVSDVGDAMLIGGLIQALFDNGIILVATSNVAPRDLYKDGLQRDLFFPAILALEANTKIIHVQSEVDYRLQLLRKNIFYFHPISEKTPGYFSDLFYHLACGMPAENNNIYIEGRTLQSVQQGSGVIWFEFNVLFYGPRSVADYIVLSKQFTTMLISNVPILSSDSEDAARRFINFIDECYDRKVKLILSAEAPIEGLYTGERLKFEFERTKSRLIEMQSSEYLLLAHLC